MRQEHAVEPDRRVGRRLCARERPGLLAQVGRGLEQPAPAGRRIDDAEAGRQAALVGIEPGRVLGGGVELRRPAVLGRSEHDDVRRRRGGVERRAARQRGQRRQAADGDREDVRHPGGCSARGSCALPSASAAELTVPSPAGPASCRSCRPRRRPGVRVSNASDGAPGSLRGVDRAARFYKFAARRPWHGAAHGPGGGAEGSSTSRLATCNRPGRLTRGHPPGAGRHLVRGDRAGVAS
jgi:hypothetical protein